MKTLNCPSCPAGGTSLVVVERQGIEIDYCPTCRGVWLDRGELDKLLEQAAPPAADRDERSRRDRDQDRDPDRGRERDRDRYRDRDRDDDDGDDRRRFGFGGDRRASEPRRRREGILGELFDF